MSYREKPISLNQVIDLIHAGPEAAARMGQYPQIWERMPYLCAELDTIASKLETLGIDGWGILRKQKRLRKVFSYYDCWKDIQIYGQDTSGRPLCFTIVASPMRKQSGSMELIMKEMVRRKGEIELQLIEGELRGTCGGLAFSFPAQFEEPGSLKISRDFLKVLLHSLKRDEILKCRLDEKVYEVNGSRYRPSAPPRTL